MKYHFFSISICMFHLIFLFYPTHQVFSKVLVLEGSEQTYYKIDSKLPAGITVPEYSNYGFSQSVEETVSKDDLLVTVTVTHDPLKRQERFSLPLCENNKSSKTGFFAKFIDDKKNSAKDELLAKTKELVCDKHYLIDAVNSIVFWIIQSIKVTNKTEDPRDVSSIMKRGRGNCVDISNLAHALLKKANISSRLVHGIVFKEIVHKHGWIDYRGEFHRWLEVYIPPYGWLFFDPTISCGLVSSDYIVLFIEQSELVFPDFLSKKDFLKLSEHINLIKNRDGVFITDCIPDQKSLILMRRIGIEQHTASIYGFVYYSDGSPCTRGSLILKHQNGAQSINPLNNQGRYSAYCLDPGIYNIVLEFPTQLIPIRDVHLLDGEVKRLDLSIGKN